MAAQSIPHVDASLEAVGDSAERVQRLARTIIAAARRRLQWLLRLPELSSVLAEGLVELELPGPRQGISLQGALDALAIENKFTLARWALQKFRRRFPACWVQRLGVEWSLVVPKHEELDTHLSATQWADMREQLSQALAREQRRYKQAQATLFHAHARLIVAHVARSVFAHEKRADAQQEAALALLAAIDRVEDDGRSFAAYAQQWIARGVRNFLLRERLPVYAPVNLVSRALRAGEGLPDGLLEPRVELDSPETKVELGEEDSARSSTDSSLTGELVRDCLGRLTQKQREVIELRYGFGAEPPMTVQEIARRVGISHQQVSMREKRALEALAAMLGPIAAELVR